MQGMWLVHVVQVLYLAHRGEMMRGLGLGFTILWEQGECWTCVYVWVAVVWVGRRLGLGFGGVEWCYVCVSCNCGLFVYIAGPAICILC